jgi:hypothetical protein
METNHKFSHTNYTPLPVRSTTDDARHPLDAPLLNVALTKPDVYQALRIQKSSLLGRNRDDVLS